MDQPFSATVVPPIRDPFEDARKDHLLLQQTNTTLTEQLAVAMDLNSKLAADVDSRGREIERLSQGVADRDRQIQMLQGFASRLITRLDVIQEQIIKAKQEAAAEAYQLGLRGETAEEKADSLKVRDIFERTEPLMPTNKLT